MAKKEKSLIKNRNGIWYVWFEFRKQQVHKSTGLPVGPKENEKIASELAHEEKSKIYQKKVMGNFTHTWEEAVTEYLKRRKRKYQANGTLNADKYMKEVAAIFDRLEPFFGNKNIDEICQDDYNKAKDFLYQDGCSSPRVNKLLEPVRSVLLLCRDVLENEDKSPWLNRVPKLELEPKSKKRIVKLNPQKFWELYDAAPDPHKGMMIVAITSGLRDTPIRLMEKTWLHIDEVNDEGVKRSWVSIPPVYQKTDEPIDAPLTEMAVEAIKQEMEKYPKSKFVFNSRLGKPLAQSSSKGWYTALEKVGLKGQFRWHDLRHVFAANLVLQKTPKSVIKQLGSWKSDSMIDNYAHLEGQALGDFVEAASSNIVSFRSKKSA